MTHYKNVKLKYLTEKKHQNDVFETKHRWPFERERDWAGILIDFCLKIFRIFPPLHFSLDLTD